MKKLIDENRKPRHYRLHRPPLTIAQILAWADAHHKRTGEWPTDRSGPVYEAADESWGKINSALRHGVRGLSGGTSLRRLIGEQRGFRPRLTVEQVLAWADEHRERTGKRATVDSGAVHGVVGENWQAIDRALRRGSRGLPGGSSLAMLLDEQRGPRPRSGTTCSCATNTSGSLTGSTGGMGLRRRQAMAGC